jgi:hypothetical protein
LGIVLRHFLISIDGMVHWDLCGTDLDHKKQFKTSLENT